MHLFHTFFDASFWASFFEILVRLGAKKFDFVSPLAPSWAQHGAQNRPSSAKSRKIELAGLPKFISMVVPFDFIASEIAFGALLGTISSDF